MLMDLLNEFVGHVKQYYEFDSDTMLLENYQFKPGLYIRLNDDGGIDELYVTKRMVLPENDSLVEWFKLADFNSSLIEMNKPVDPKKQIHSNNIYTLFCKRDVIYDSDEKHSDFIVHIDRYFNSILSPKDKASTEILVAAGYEPIQKEVVEANKKRFISSLNKVVERIKQLEIKDNCYIKIFLNVSEEVYAFESGRYLLPKIFNCSDYNIPVEESVLGLSNTDMGMNAKKPYLEHKTTNFKVPYRVTANEAILLRKLYLWLNGQGREGRPLYSGYMPIWDHSPELFATAGEVDVRKPVMYLHFDRGIALTIDDYDYLPNFSDRLDKPVVFYNYLNAEKYQGGTFNKLSTVEAHINENLYAFQLIYNYYTERIKVSEKLPQALANQIMLTREAMHAWLRKGITLPLQNRIEKMTMNVILARLQNLNYIPALAHALNVRFSLIKYFSEEENDMGLTIGTAYQELKDKVLNSKDIVTCQNDMEYYLAVGQLLRYFFWLSEAQSIQYDVLWRGVTAAQNADDIKQEYRKYFQRYSYKIKINNKRFNTMLSIASSYDSEKEKPVNLDALFFGFTAENIIYFKEKEDN